MAKLKGQPEITRFKGLGEISPGEFKHFIGEDIRLDPVIVDKDSSLSDLLSFYMGKNTPERQEFIIENLVVEKDLAAEDDDEIEEVEEEEVPARTGVESGEEETVEES